MTRKPRKGSGARTVTGSVIGRQEAAEMARLQITHVPVDYFHYGEFRYTNLKDAIAQAKRPHRTG